MPPKIHFSRQLPGLDSSSELMLPDRLSSMVVGNHCGYRRDSKWKRWKIRRRRGRRTYTRGWANCSQCQATIRAGRPATDRIPSRSALLTSFLGFGIVVASAFGVEWSGDPPFIRKTTELSSKTLFTYCSPLQSRAPEDHEDQYPSDSKTQCRSGSDDR